MLWYYIYAPPSIKSMGAKCLINFLSTEEKRVAYAEACAFLGTSVSEICRRALDNSVLLSEKMKAEKRAATMDKVIADNKRSLDSLSGASP